jgi:hypothetical protein
MTQKEAQMEKLERHNEPASLRQAAWETVLVVGGAWGTVIAAQSLKQAFKGGLKIANRYVIHKLADLLDQAQAELDGVAEDGPVHTAATVGSRAAEIAKELT